MLEEEGAVPRDGICRSGKAGGRAVWGCAQNWAQALRATPPPRSRLGALPQALAESLPGECVSCVGPCAHCSDKERDTKVKCLP